MAYSARRSAFTLIELLVVIAIVAILAALLYPVFVTVKAKSLQTQCANNIKQIMLAALKYADDWNNRLPGLNAFGELIDGKFATSHASNPNTGRGTLWQYLRTKAVYVCPVDIAHRYAYDPNNPAKPTGYNYTYTVNSWMTLASEDRRLADIAGPPVNKSRNPSRTVFLVDENTDPEKGLCAVNDAHFANGDSTCDRHPGPGYYSNDAGKGIAQGCANVGYLDAHLGIVPGLLRYDSPQGQKVFWH